MSTKKTKKKANPKAKAARIIVRANNEQMHVILRNALTWVEGTNPRGKLSAFALDAMLNYRPKAKIKRGARP